MTHIPHSPSLPSPYIIKSCFFSCYSVSCQFVRPTRRTWRGGGNAFLPNRCANTCCLGFHFFPVHNCSGAAGSFSGSVSDFLRNPDRPPLSGPVPAGPPRLSQPHTAVRCTRGHRLFPHFGLASPKAVLKAPRAQLCHSGRPASAQPLALLQPDSCIQPRGPRATATSLSTWHGSWPRTVRFPLHLYLAAPCF